MVSTLPGSSGVVLKSVLSEAAGKFCGPVLAVKVPVEIESRLLAQARSW